MGRKRKQPPPSPPPSWRTLRPGLDPSLTRELAEGLEYFDQPKWDDLREQVENFQQSETGRKLREIVEQLEQQPQEEEANKPPRPRNRGGRPRSLTKEQINQCVTKLKTRPDLIEQPQEALRWLRNPEQKLNLRETISDRTIRRRVINPLRDKT